MKPLQISLLTLCLLLSTFISISAQPDPNTSFSVTNPDNSDYRILLTFNYNPNYCDCSQSTTINIYEQITLLGPIIATYTAPHTDVTILVGPGYDENVAAGFFMTGERSWPGYSPPGNLCLTGGCGVLPDCPCSDIFGTPTVHITTSALKNPTGVTATTGTYPDKIVLTWGKGTNFPNSEHDYIIYRDGDSLTTVSGSGPYTYTDLGLPQGDEHDYTIKTHITSYGDQESSGVTVSGSTFAIDATDGNYYGRVRLTWSNVPANTEDIRIERSVHNAFGVQEGVEELVIMNANATAYNDNGGVPGFAYTYYVKPLDTNGSEIITYTDTGYSKPNGKISGHIRSQVGVGVLGIDVEVTLQDAIPAGGGALPGGCTVTYCATTDVDGYYEVPDVFYYTEADFEIKPLRSGHVFTPDSVVRTLSENGNVLAGIDFTDETVFTVGGRVTWPEYANDTCGIKNAVIRIDTNDFGIKTMSDGYWVFTLFNQGFYEFSVDYYDHHFENILGQTTSTVYIDTDVLDIDFIDMETGDIQVIAQGGCQTPLGDSVQVRVEAPENCWNELYWTDPDGTLTIEDVPARDYTVKVIDIAGAAQPTNILNQIGELGGVEIDVDLTSKDSIYMRMDFDTTIITPESYDTLPNSQIIVTPADTQLITVQDSILKPVNSTARFIYRSPLDIGIDFANAGANVLDGCMNSEGENIILMEKGVEYVLLIDVSESLNMQCPIDSGYLKIYDNIGDLEDNPVRIPIVNGLAEYHVVAGNPVIATSPVHNHEKFLYIVPEVDQLEAEPLTYWVLVTGVKNNTPSLITRSPEIPTLILHDPPGDNSYAFVEEGQSFRSFTTTSYLSNEEGGGFVNIGGGLKADIFSVNIKLGAFANIAISGGKNEKNEDGIETVLTFTQQFSTSSADNFAGDEGDVYIGASFNQEFSIGESLMYDESMCAVETDSIPQLDLAGFATTFYYTEKHIKQTLLPTIALLMKEFKEGSPASTTEQDSIRFNRLRADSVSWVRILNQNELARDSLAIFDENITFSAGATVSKTFSSNETNSHSYEYETFVNEEFEVGGVFEFEGFGAYVETKAGFMGKFRQTWAGSSGDDTTTTRTVGYVLDDGDIGDFFSIDVKRDTSFNVPAFNLVLGTSSCPHEEGTQTRDKPTIRILEPQADDVPIDEAATFTVQLNNESESGETREYHVRVVSTTNPEGALFDLGGRNINNGPATFFLEKGQTLNVQLSVKKGPLASNYNQMGIMIYPPCEYALWQDNGVLKNADTAYVTVNFQSTCTNVSLYNPGDGWLVNQNNNDILHATFTGYNIFNPNFESLTLQLKREGEGYVNQVTIPKEDIAGPYHDVFLDVSNFEDGSYRLRARANCQTGSGYTYSSEQKGIIDRLSLAPFGMPSPSDGFLQAGQEISVTYDKDINCDLGLYPTDISLVRDDTDMPLAFTTQCLGNKLIIVTNPPLVEVPDLDGVEVTARVHLLEDLNGNVQKYPVEWTFKVNSKPVFWDPDMLYASANEGETTIIAGMLKNDALLSKAFSLNVADAPGIIDYPTWLTPLQTRGTVLSNSNYNVEFAVDPDLLPGLYAGEVTAAVDSLPVSMQVVFELFAKPVNWQFNPAQYANSMNVVAQFSLTAANAPLSDDPRDMIGAFVNGEIRGIANIEWVPEKSVYAAFLTVYSDDDGGSNAEDISFHYWKALSGIEYKATEKLPFQKNGAIGTASSPFILHPDGIFQIIPLTAGWNWISLNVENSDMSREHVFESIISSQSTNTILIKSQMQSAEYNPTSGWLGNLKDLVIGKGYLVHLSDHLDTLRVAGFPPAGPVLINVSNVWNWIGFPEQVPRPVNEVLETIALTDGDLLKSQHAFAAFDGSISSWIGNLKSFEPGGGYKLHLQSNGILEYELLEGAPEASLFEFNMNVTAVLDPDMLDHSHGGDLLVHAFINGVQMAEANVVYVPALDEYRAQLLIHGTTEMQDAQVEFRVENTRRNTRYFSNGDAVQFTLDGITGTVIEPYELFSYQPEQHAIDEEEYELFQNIPNPMEETTVIRFRIPGPKEVVIDIFDSDGTLISQTKEEYTQQGLHSMEISLQGMPSGIYYYRMTTDTFSAVKKLAKQ